ncbi:Protein of unknown function (DUF3365) [Shewanella psychrophila]|uniref:Tll0287-like domain-containing protein n=1 Tax=Shewanella psychrophila TaxID=225848 RepID=A0A1S6HRY4_9GAMM|nr:DUF3365 domain-containing protein [Shewanella psychrophila]AQS38262.1 Protein of unknown function (DUF3365) [Shewanella psychrophila]
MKQELILLLLVVFLSPAYSQEMDDLPEVRIADAIKDILISTRKVYTSEVSNKLFEDGTGSIKDYAHYKGFAPLPAQLIKEIGKELNRESQNEIIIHLKSKYFVNEESRLVDSQERAGWTFLMEQQNAATNVKEMRWQPYLYISDKNGVDYLTYMSADTATSEQCVSCHEVQELNASVQYARKQHGIMDKPVLKRWHMIGIYKIEIKLK